MRTEWSNPAAELNAYNLYLSASTNVPGAQPQVTISWPDEYGLRTYANSISYTIYRKSTGQASWGSQLATVTGMNGANIRTSYTDSTVSAGQIYEYRVDRTGMGGSAVQKGYIAAGVNAADSLQENRGTVLLVVDDRFVNSLEFEIAQLKQDLIGDGWKVQILSEHVYGTDINDPNVRNVSQVKADIASAYNANHNTSNEVKSVLLLGHIPVQLSGWYWPDGHSDNPRPLPADVYYGDMDGVWTDSTTYPFDPTLWHANGGVQNVANDGILDPGYDSDGSPNSYDYIGVPIAGDANGEPVELSVGRVDMHDMGKFDSTATYSGNGAWQTYSIPVGQFYTGNFDYLSLVSGDSTGLTSANPAAGIGEFRNIKIHAAGLPGTAINFSGYTNANFLPAREPTGTNRYGYDQKGSGPDAASNVSTSGTTVTMTGDAWRVIDAFGGSGITISPNTVLEFEFRSSDVSQVVGIGFDKNGADFDNHYEFISEDQTFRVHAAGGDSIGWGREMDPNLETELLRRYLDKDHAFRQGEFDVQCPCGYKWAD